MIKKIGKSIVTIINVVDKEYCYNNMECHGAACEFKCSGSNNRKGTMNSKCYNCPYYLQK